MEKQNFFFFVFHFLSLQIFNWADAMNWALFWLDILISLRLQSLQLYHPQLQNYKQTSASLIDWIDATRKNQNALQATKIDSIQALKDHIDAQKVSCSAIHYYQPIF